ncbi:hypothetical protein [Paenibacillus sp. NPDC058174]|uniref:hypothetical protein n=1 Tax=Paenibacillus sp. NPDC058174 TaxID=3346366 RepID=UPI0036DA5983
MTDMLRVKNPNTGKYELISINEILYFVFNNDSFTRVGSDKYELLLPITEIGLKEIIEEYEFTASDRYVFVNTNKMKKLHSSLNSIIFADVTSLQEAKQLNVPTVFMHSKYAPKIRAILGVENDLAYKLTKKNSKYILKRNVFDEIS